MNEQTIEEANECLAQADPETRREIEAFIFSVRILEPEEREAVINRMRKLQPLRAQPK